MARRERLESIGIVTVSATKESELAESSGRSVLSLAVPDSKSDIRRANGGVATPFGPSAPRPYPYCIGIAPWTPAGTAGIHINLTTGICQ